MSLEIMDWDLLGSYMLDIEACKSEKTAEDCINFNPSWFTFSFICCSDCEQVRRNLRQTNKTKKTANPKGKMIVSISFLINLSVEKKGMWRPGKILNFFMFAWCSWLSDSSVFFLFFFFFFLPRIFVLFGVINMLLASFAEGCLLDQSLY